MCAETEPSANGDFCKNSECVVDEPHRAHPLALDCSEMSCQSSSAVYSPRHVRASSVPFEPLCTSSTDGWQSDSNSPRKVHQAPATDHSPFKASPFKAKSALLRKLRHLTPDEVCRTEPAGDAQAFRELFPPLATSSDDSAEHPPEGSGEKQACLARLIDGLHAYRRT
jgi:hypothetical protein